MRSIFRCRAIGGSDRILVRSTRSTFPQASLRFDRSTELTIWGKAPDTMQCVFWTMNKKQIVARNSLAYAVRDTSPVTPIHTLILPNRHIASYFDLDADEKHAIDDLLEESRVGILACDPAVGGFNIGVNVGVVAG